MKSPVFFSVIVPCYNVGAGMINLLRDITQQMDDECELVLVNDGSTDDTSARIRAFIGGSPRRSQIIFTETANAGAARARSTGLSLARGEFVFFCDSDDLIGSDLVHQVREQARLHPRMDLMYFSSTMVTDGDELLTPVACKVTYEEARAFEHGGDLLSHHLNRGMYTAAVWTFVARKTLIVDSGAVFTDRAAHEDHLFTLKVIMGARFIVAVPDVLYRQKVRPGSLTNSRKNSAYVIERIAAYREADQFLSRVAAPRKSYGEWSFHSVMHLLNENRALVPKVVCSVAGACFFAIHIVDLVEWLTRSATRRLTRR